MPAAPLGHFCWPERLTFEADGIRAFYATIFDWHFEAVASSGGAYLIALRDGAPVAGLLRAPAAAGPARWNSYVQVADAGALAERAADLGGTLRAGPTDVPGVGRMAFLRDPGGAELGLWQSGGHSGALRFDSPGALAWTELVTPEPDPAAAFHTALFGWEARPRTDMARPYVEFLEAGAPVAGLLPAPRRTAAWRPYFGCADPTRTAALAREAGGRVVVPPTDLPGLGTFALLADLEGVEVGLLNLN